MLPSVHTCWVCNPVCTCSEIPEVDPGSPGCCCNDDGHLRIRPPLDSGGRTSCCFSGGKHLHLHLGNVKEVQKQSETKNEGLRWLQPKKLLIWNKKRGYFSPSSPPCKQRPAPFPPRVAHQPHWGLEMHWEHWVSCEHCGVQESPPERRRPHWPASHRRGTKDGLKH